MLEQRETRRYDPSGEYYIVTEEEDKRQKLRMELEDAERRLARLKDWLRANADKMVLIMASSPNAVLDVANSIKKESATIADLKQRLERL